MNTWIEQVDKLLGFKQPTAQYTDAWGTTHVDVQCHDHFTIFKKQGNKLVPSFDSEEAILTNVRIEYEQY